jgi:hypothetical protein
LHTILEELVAIEETSNKAWRDLQDTLNVLDHELEVVPLNGGQLLKVASFRRKARIERRNHKNAWYCSKAFNDAFQTGRVLNSMNNAFKHLRRQEKAGEDLIEDRGLIASILAKPEPVEEMAVLEVVPSAEAEVAATLTELIPE